MEWVKLKNLVKQNGDKFILVENGEPEIVMMSFREYQKLANQNVIDADPRMDHANSANDAVYADPGLGRLKETEFIDPFESESAGLPVRLEDIRLEDLPI